MKSFFASHNVRYQGAIDHRIEQMRGTISLTEDEGVVGPAKRMVIALVRQLKPLLASIAEYDRAILQLSQDMADYRIFESFPGAAKALAPRLMAAFGEDRQRYDKAAQVQRYAGIAPVTERSGKSEWVHFRYRCPTFMRQTFVEWAGQTVPRSAWAGTFYRQQRARGAHHHTAIRALAFKWLRIMFRCWQDRTEYDESAYIKTLERRGSPLVKPTAQG